jgi:hypothetical protein
MAHLLQMVDGPAGSTLLTVLVLVAQEIRHLLETAPILLSVMVASFALLNIHLKCRTQLVSKLKQRTHLVPYSLVQ